jgi:hypothetical protein
LLCDICMSTLARRTPLFWMSDVDYSTPGKSFTETNFPS